ncbi:MAG TPA: NupC/NupG family nucleoside CNT transporter [Longimicrobium sp.]|nr:NupC/NupG family nucleoside CNT transporter [Longimicrobium sp.]
MPSRTPKKRPGWLMPLWLAAALLLGAGWFAHAQEPAPSDTAAAATAPPPVTPQPAGATAPPAGAQPGGAAGAGTAAQPVDSAVPQTTVPSESGVPQAEPGPVTGGQTAAAQAARLAAEEARGGTLPERAVSLLGLLVFIAMAWLMSVNKRAVTWRPVIWGVALQLIFALLIIRTELGRDTFDALNTVFTSLLGYTNEGARFLFGNLTTKNVPVGAGSGPFSPVTGTGTWADAGANFAFSVLPTIIFFSSLMTLLYYFGIMQLFVKAFAWVMVRTMGTSGSESLNAAGNIFVGQTEAPLLVKPFVKSMTNSELHAVMTGGFATVAGGVMAAYIGMLVAYFPNIAGHLLAASVMSAPAALAISKLMYPETEESVTRGQMKVQLEKVDANAIDAAARGASEGLSLALNVGAMLLAFIALLALLNGILGGIGGWFGMEWSIQNGLAYLGAPLAWLMGTPWQDAMAVGTLIGEKTAVNEFVAYAHLAEMLQGGADLSARAVVVATYALCGFANFSSIAIQIGGIGGLAPERRGDLSRLGLRAMIAGTLASFMTACVVTMIL